MSLVVRQYLQRQLSSVITTTRDLQASSFEEASQKCQNIGLALQRMHFLLGNACNTLEARISQNDNELMACQKLCTQLTEQLAIEREKKENLIIKRAGLKEQKEVQEERHLALQREIRALKLQIEKNKETLEGYAVVGTVMTVVTIVAAPFSGGLTLLGLGATAATAVGATNLATLQEELRERKSRVVRKIEDLEDEIESLSTKIKKQSTKIKKLETLLEELNSKLYGNDYEIKTLGSNLTNIKNNYFTLKRLQQNCHLLQTDLNFLQELVQDGCLEQDQVTDFLKNTLQFESSCLAVGSSD
jgi:DNA repair exonuclease SbcCD ATPase subunit